MASLGRAPSVWVSGITTPIVKAEVFAYFSREARVQDVIIPNMEDGSCGVVFTSEEDVKKALLLDGHSFRDDTIRVCIPSASQYALIEDCTSQEQTVDDTLSDLATTLSALPHDQLTKLFSMIGTAKEGTQKTHSPEKKPQLKFSTDQHRAMYESGPLPSPTTSYHLMHTQPYYSQCRIAQFSGDSVKGETDYAHWRHEVQSLISEGCPSSQILPAIRKSVKGTAADVLLNMGVSVNEHDILSKFDIIFGNVLPSEVLLEDFYTARQQPDESIVPWACRLESLLARATKGTSDRGDNSKMLRTKFWGGLRDGNVKNGIRHRYDAGDSFSNLLQAARQIEHESAIDTPSNLNNHAP